MRKAEDQTGHCSPSPGGVLLWHSLLHINLHVIQIPALPVPSVVPKEPVQLGRAKLLPEE